MIQSAHLRRVGWTTRAASAYAATFALLTTIIYFLPISAAGASQSVGSAFLSLLRDGLLPPGATLVSPNATEGYIVASLSFAFITSYPLAAYVGMRTVYRGIYGTRGLALLVSGAIGLFYGGCVAGYYYAAYQISMNMQQLNRIVGICCFFDSYSFYTLILRDIVIGAILFTLPAYIIAFAVGSQKTVSKHYGSSS